MVAATLLLAFGQEIRGNPAMSQAPAAAKADPWLAAAVRDKHCPLKPVNVPPATLLQHTSGGGLGQQVSIVGDTLQIEGTPDPDHIVIKGGGAAAVVRVTYDGVDLGSFGPVSRIRVEAGAGDNVVVVKPDVKIPVQLVGGTGDDCLESGSGADVVLGGDGNDVLIAGTGRPALKTETGKSRIVVPQSMGTISAAPSADAKVLKELSGIYTVQPLPQGPGSSSQASPNPIVLAPADLGDAGILARLQATYDAGQAVVLTNATADDAERLRSLLGHPNAAERRNGGTAALFYFRKSPRQGSEAHDYSTGFFASLPSQLNDYTTQLLSQVFSATAIAPGACPTNTPNLLQCLADGHTNTAVSTDSAGSSVTIHNTVWSVRSFDNSADFYYVSQEVDYDWAAGDNAGLLVGLTNSQFQEMHPTLLQPSPASTQCTESTTSGVNFSFGGSAGWNYMQGANAELTEGVSISNSMTITCPGIGIVNEANEESAIVQWEYIPATELPGTSQAFYNLWIWEVPFSHYSTGQKTIFLDSYAEAAASCDNCNIIKNGFNSSFPVPFGDTFALQKPTVLSVNPTCANAGTTFMINGTGFYPDLVQRVLIGGTSSTFSPVSDTELDVVAPDQSGDAWPVVVQTGLGTSNSNVTIEISVIDLCGSAQTRAARR
jgi:hypothetical protein